MVQVSRFVVDRFAGVITTAGCLALAAATLHIFADALMTKFLLAPIIGTHQIVTHYYMVSLFFLPLGYAESKNAHIVADLVFERLGPALKWMVASVNYLLLTVFTTILLWQSILKTIDQTRVGESEELGAFTMILWPSRWIAVLGIAAMLAVCLVKTIDIILSRSHQGTIQSAGEASHD